MKDTYKKEFNAPVTTSAVVAILFKDWQGKHQSDGTMIPVGAEQNAYARRAVMGGFNPIVLNMKNDSSAIARVVLQHSADGSSWTQLATVDITPSGSATLTGTVVLDYWRVTVLGVKVGTIAIEGSLLGTWIVPLEQANIPELLHEGGCISSCQSGCEGTCESLCQVGIE